MRTPHSLALLLVVSLSSCLGPFRDGVSSGEPPPPLPTVEWLETAEAPPESLAELKGSPVLLEFWSRQCRPCVVNIPKIQRLQAG